MSIDSATGTDTAVLGADHARLAETLIRWLADGVRPARLFAPEVFADVSLPQWRLQATNAEELYAIREGGGHTGGGRVSVEGLDRTTRGFLLQFAERWAAGGQRWYARELIHAVVTGGLITELIVYCTGDWDEATQRRHATEVYLPRP